MDFFAITKNFWDEAPDMEGFKPDYAALFFAIVDSVNRNLWKETEIEYDRLINKTKLGKRMYLAGRDWLAQNNFILYSKGRNDFSRAKYNIVVQNYTSTDTTGVTSTDTSTAPQVSINCTPTVPYLNKTLDNKTKRPINIDFIIFWDLYDNKVDKAKSEKKWNSLKDSERQAAIEDIPKYLQSLDDRKYQKNPHTYLNGKCWMDERKSSPQAQSQKNNLDPSKYYPNGLPRLVI